MADELVIANDQYEVWDHAGDEYLLYTRSGDGYVYSGRFFVDGESWRIYSHLPYDGSVRYPVWEDALDALLDICVDMGMIDKMEETSE